MIAPHQTEIFQGMFDTVINLTPSEFHVKPIIMYFEN